LSPRLSVESFGRGRPSTQRRFAFLPLFSPPESTAAQSVFFFSPFFQTFVFVFDVPRVPILARFMLHSFLCAILIRLLFPAPSSRLFGAYPRLYGNEVPFFAGLVSIGSHFVVSLVGPLWFFFPLSPLFLHFPPTPSGTAFSFSLLDCGRAVAAAVWRRSWSTLQRQLL